MPLTAGTRIGPYEIKSPLGEGGMGVVFRALDTKLQREVALKLLPDHFADDPERLARFQREAQVLASLNHTNIAQIHGLEDSTSQKCIVMELVEGETLQEHLKRGPVPVDEALAIAKQICEALEAAHEKGIIHRDLKPANIKLTKDGAVKVLDFGLARMRETEGATTSLSNSPTLISAASMPGMIMGTAAYMAPEQAKGKAVDRRADIWAFGVVLFEALTGQKLFTGETASEIMAFVMTKDPDWRSLPAGVSRSIRDLLRRCLIKDPRARLQSIGDARVLIEEAIAKPEHAETETSEGVPWHRRPILLWLVAGALALSLGVILWSSWRGAPEALRSLRLTAELGADRVLDNGFGAAAILSPDGQILAFSAIDNIKTQIFVRPLDQLKATPLPGTDRARNLFFLRMDDGLVSLPMGSSKRFLAAEAPPSHCATLPTIVGVPGARTARSFSARPRILRSCASFLPEALLNH